MREINIAKNISDLRKSRGITQEQLAAELSISPQAVSKWETNASQPDIQLLPLIADYFGVSIDYLFYGQDIPCSEIYGEVFAKTAAYPMMSKESYEDALTLFGYAHHGISNGNLTDGHIEIHERPAHISDQNGVSLLSGKGYGAILTRSFFERVDRDTAEYAAQLLPVLADKNNLLVCMAIISMSDISFGELQEKLDFDENTLRKSLDCLIGAQLVIETESKHKSLGFTYCIREICHTCLCILIATIEMQRYSFGGIACCMGYGDFPIRL
ncbi:MAG: helix-turn-helix transcriptional regulator [Clostridia bacterium]|nr:helix-turn-helix transcriptional regulator [Clostridia bacterium]